MKKRGALELPIKSLFAIFVVVFVIFILVSVIRSRTEILEQRETMNYYESSRNFLLALMSSPCLAADYYVGNLNYHQSSQGHLSVSKLNVRHKANQDFECIENFNFIYSIDIIDQTNQKSWKVGLRYYPPFAEEVVSTPFPVALNYGFQALNSGTAILNAYIGNIPRFYGTIKQACVLRESATYKLESNYRIKYDNAQNKFNVSDYLFFPYFSCKVNDFEIEKGETLVYIRYNEADRSVDIV